MNSRVPMDYSKIKDLSILTQEDLSTIHYKAKALTKEELYDYLCLTPDMLTQHERNIFTIAYKRGRCEGIAMATENLFAHMKTRAGGATCLAYLQQLSPTFKAVHVSPNSSMPNGFQFNVVMNDDTKAESSDSSGSGVSLN